MWGIELKVSHTQSKHGTVKPWEISMYLIKYIFVNVVYYSHRILFIAVSIKNIVDMSGNKQFGFLNEFLFTSGASFRWQCKHKQTTGSV